MVWIAMLIQCLVVGGIMWLAYMPYSDLKNILIFATAFGAFAVNLLIIGDMARKRRAS